MDGIAAIRNIRDSRSPSPEDLEVVGNPGYLHKALANIVRNALRYAGDSGPIVISAEQCDRDVAIRIADSGPGIPESEIEDVFKPFYRLETARQRETGGVGLGLAIVRNCVEASGGIVQCRNRSPNGLEVEIRLPRVPLETPDAPARASRSIPQKS